MKAQPKKDIEEKFRQIFLLSLHIRLLFFFGFFLEQIDRSIQKIFFIITCYALHCENKGRFSLLNIFFHVRMQIIIFKKMEYYSASYLSTCFWEMPMG